MKNYLKVKFIFISVLCISFFFYSHQVSAQFTALSKIADLTFNLEEGDVLFLDIDQTLLLPGEKKYEDPVKAIEADIADTIKRLRSKGVIILGLTARHPKYADKTEEQLKDIDLDFSAMIHIDRIKPEYFGRLKGEAGFIKGIIYAKRSSETKAQGKSAKGETLIGFLNFFKLSKDEQEELSEASKFANVSTLELSKIKRIAFVDDFTPNNESVKDALAESEYKGIELLNYHFKPELTNDEDRKLYEYSVKARQQFPEDITDLSYSETLEGGSGGVHIMEDESKRRFTLKCNIGNLDHYKEELAADALTLALGLNAPDFAIYNHRPEDEKLSEEACPSDQPFYRIAQFIKKTEDPSAEKLKQKFSERFVGDAYLANWDVVVGKGKNAILSTDDNLYSIDHGGALRYRAKGELKATDENWTADEVTELKMMRDPTTNRDGAEIYDGLSDDDIEEQAKDVIEAKPKLTKELQRIHHVIGLNKYGELNQMLNNRTEHLKSLYGMDVEEKSPYSELANRFEPAVPGKTSAGTFIFAEVNGEYYTLLGQRIKHKWWGNLGGKSELGQDLLSDTAAQENFEESNKLISLLAEELHDAPSHDLISGDQLYRMYFVDYKYIEAKEFMDALGTTGEHSNEYTDFAWVNIKDLLRNVLASKTIQEESTETIALTTTAAGEDKTREIILHPPLFYMLRQKPVLKILDDIIRKNRLKSVHTKGEAESKFEPISDVDPGTYVIKKPKWAPVQTPKVQRPTPEYVPLTDQASKEHLRRAIVNKARAMVEMKQRKKPAPYTSPKNSEMKAKLKDLPLTQSEVHMRSLMGPDYLGVTDENVRKAIPQNIHKYLTEKSALTHIFSSSQKSYAVGDSLDHPFIKAMTEAWLEERKPENKSRIFAYHGVDPIIGLLYDLFTEVKRQFLITGLAENVATRSLDTAFENIFTVQDFIREQLIKQDLKSAKEITNYQADFQQKGLSANMFLFGSDGHETSSTARYVFDGYSSSPPEFDKLLDYFKQSIGVDFKNEEVIQLLKNYSLDKSGRLFQFIFEPEIAEELLYSSYAQGRAAELPNLPGYKPGYKGAFGVIETARRKVADLKNAISGGKLDRLQFRIFVKPQKMQDASKVTVKHYWGSIPPTQENLKAYQKKLRVFAQQITLQLLKNKILIPEGVLSEADQSKDKLSPIQRLTKYVQEGTSGEIYTAEKSSALLPAALYKGRPELVKRLLKQNPDIDLSQNMEYLTPGGQLVTFNPIIDAIETAHKDNKIDEEEIKERYRKVVEVLTPLITADLATNSLHAALKSTGRAYHVLIDKFKADKSVITKDMVTQLVNDEEHINKPLVELMAKYGFDPKGLTDKGTPYLWVAANDNDSEALGLLIDQGASPTHTDKNGQSIIFYAVNIDRLAIVKKLVEKGANIHSFDLYTGNLLHMALMHRRTSPELIDYLIEMEVDVNAKNNDKKTPLYLASYNSNIDAARKMLEKGAILKTKAGEWSPLHTAARWGHIDLVKLYLEKGADPNTPGYFFDGTALHSAAEGGNVEIITLLLKAGAKLDARSSQGNTPLHLAAKKGNLEAITYLIEQGADLDAENNKKETPLRIAFDEGHAEIVEELERRGAKAIDKSNLNVEKLHEAIQKGNILLVKAIIASGADLNIYKTEYRISVSSVKATPLHVAAHVGNFDIVTLLISKGADIEAVTKHYRESSQETALQIAAKKGHLVIVQELVKNGAKTINPDGKNSAFHAAAYGGSIDTVKYFLEQGMDINTRNFEEKTALYETSSNRKPEVVELLLKRGADPNLTDDRGDSPLHRAAYFGRVENAVLLINAKADLNLKNKYGDTALHIALKKGHLPVSKLLIENGAKINEKNKKGQTPLDIAYLAADEQAVKLLSSLNAERDEKYTFGADKIHEAIDTQKSDYLEFLLKNGASPKNEDYSGHMPVHKAVIKNDKKAVELFIKYGADFYHPVNIKNYYPTGDHNVAGKNAFEIAIIYNHLNLLNMMIEEVPNFDINRQNDKGLTLLHSAIPTKNTPAIELLLKKGAKLESKTSKGNTPLHLAAKAGAFEVVTFLLEQGSEIDAENNEGKTPLKLAFDNGHEKVVADLEERGAKAIEKKNFGADKLHDAVKDGDIVLVKKILRSGTNVDSYKELYFSETGSMKVTPLHIACIKDNLEMVKLLLSFKADIELTTNPKSYTENLTPLELTAEQGHENIAGELLVNGAKAVTEKGEHSALQQAVSGRRLNMVKFLIDKGVNINTQNSLQQTALHNAIEWRQEEIAEFLIKAGSDLTIKDYAQKTPLDYAREKNNTKLIQLMESSLGNAS